MRSHGLPVAYVSGSMPRDLRDSTIADFKSGKLRGLANANLLTTGFDHPRLDLIALLRPTLSTGLYVQMLGRGMRIAEDKTNCLVLDFARNVARHGPVDMVTEPRDRERRGDGEPVVKECPECRSIIAAGLRNCPDCGHYFPPPSIEEKIDASASRAAVMRRDLAPEWAPVRAWSFHPHTKYGEKVATSVRIEYRAGINSIFKEWVTARRFVWLWTTHGGSLPYPLTISEVVSRYHELRRPTSIMVRKSGKYWEVAGRRFVEEGVAA